MFAILLLAGCARGPKTPEQAFRGLERSIAAGDASAFYALLDEDTKWAIEATLKHQRLARTIITAKYPENEAQKALAALAAADESDAQRYFAKLNEERHLVEAFRKRLGSVSGPIQSKIADATTVWVSRQDGMPFRFAKNKDGSWGFCELRGDWELERDRAQHAIKTVRENARLYEGKQ
jgi:hypothetical protein